MKKYLFIDRDGTLVCEPEDFQVDALEKIKFTRNVFINLHKLKALGYSFIMVSNQDGLGTTSFPLETFTKPHEFILEAFKSQGIDFEEVLICPHKDEDNCTCRKPKLGMVLPYLKDFSWDRDNSYFIGDRKTDLLMADGMGIKGFMLTENFSWDNVYKEIVGKKREAFIKRDTKETQIEVYTNLDDNSKKEISTGIDFFDHMLDQIATHAKISLVVKARGDLNVDEHHTIEDVGIALGEAIKKALGDKRGIRRFGFMLPMDELYASVFADKIAEECTETCLDISNRPYTNLKLDGIFSKDYVGDMPTDMVPHFFNSLAFNMGITLYMKVSEGNCHHQVEALFKAFARALGDAIRVEGHDLPSSKGAL